MGTPSTKSWIAPAAKAAESTLSVPARVLISSRSFAACGCRIPISGSRPFAVTSVASPLTLIVSSLLVALAMTRSGWPSPVEPPRVAARSTLTSLTSAQVVDGDNVGAAEGVEVDALDAGGVHRDAGDVAREPEAGAVRRQVDLLGDVGAVEEQRVGAVLALDDVATVTRIPNEGVVAGTQERDVVAAVPVDRVVPVAAEQCLRTGAAGEIVVSVPAVDRRRDRVGEDTVALVDAHLVVARPGVDDDLRDAVAFEAEVGRAVVTDVDLESARVAGLQANRDLVAHFGALDRQDAVLELRMLEPDLL